MSGLTFFGGGGQAYPPPSTLMIEPPNINSLLDPISLLPFFHRQEVLHLAVPLHLLAQNLVANLLGERIVSLRVCPSSVYGLDVVQRFSRVCCVGKDKDEAEGRVDDREDDSHDDLQVGAGGGGDFGSEGER